MVIKWADLHSLADVERMLETNIQIGASVADVQSFATAQQLECSEPVQGVIYCSAPARSDVEYVAAKWLMRFYLQQDKLARIEVEKGLIGP